MGIGGRALGLIEKQLTLYIGDPMASAIAAKKATDALGPKVTGLLEAVIGLPSRSYRDAAIIQLAYGIVAGEPFEHRRRAEGARTIAQRLGRLLQSFHISGVEDAFQNIGKNTVELARGNQPKFDALLRWADGAELFLRLGALDLALARTAGTARPVKPMPEVLSANLTFPMMARLIDQLLASPSAGAHEQFAVAAAIEAALEEFEGVGSGRLRVETKRLTASDASSGTVGDVQLKRGERTEEAIEVTANDWAEKITKAAQLLRNADLPRVHVVAKVGSDFETRRN